jgi:erythromycin esterase
MTRVTTANDPNAVDAKAASSTWMAIVRHLEDNRQSYVKKGVASRDIEWAIQNARVVLQCMQLKAGTVTRDQSMADNVKWILDNNPDAKIVLWAHNGHVSTASVGGFGPMGASLRKMFGAQMVVFGFAFNQGSFQAIERNKGLHDFTVGPAPAGSLDATLSATGIPLFALDLRSVPKGSPAAAWLSEPHKTRSIGALFSQESAQYLFDLNAPESFDVILFVDKTTAARKNP